MITIESADEVHKVLRDGKIVKEFQVLSEAKKLKSDLELQEKNKSKHDKIKAEAMKNIHLLKPKK